MASNSSAIQVKPVILCGGTGARLWPLSRTGFPKQFLCLTGKESLFQSAAIRVVGLGAPDIVVAAPIIVCGEDHRFVVAEQLREVGIAIGTALLEPTGRNTAPALTLAALAALDQGSDPVLIATPSDQTMSDTAAFNVAMQTAIREAQSGTIVILGIAPDRPETGYGYIQTSLDPTKASVGNESPSETPLVVQAFIEKPNVVRAREFIEVGNYFWNAGVFVIKASVWLKAIEKFRSDIAQATRDAWVSRTEDDNTSIQFVRLGKEEFAAIPGESIDFAVMEHCPGSDFSIQMIPLDAGWSDLGSWDAVWNVLAKDSNGNVYQGDVIHTKSHNTLVCANSRLVGVVGVKDLIVIETADAVLVADKSRSQEVKHIVSELQAAKREEHNLHRKVYRPWGWYDNIDLDNRFKVKRIQVKPKASLSLQKHQHRSEHWIVVTGTAEITKGDKVFTLTENQSTYIPAGELHRLTNSGSTILEIIEVQTGSYLGEDDILRIEDYYGRVC
jgi:mannose-1-phosphate guanylyltransferase/mannose-6-phosphate isomerase